MTTLHGQKKFHPCHDVSAYERSIKIGHGTFGEVYKARDKSTGEQVALKKILTESEKEGFPITALREVKILKQLRNEHIVRLIDVCRSNSTDGIVDKCSIYLVFEFCEHDLAGLLSNTDVRFTLGEAKGLMHQLFTGLYYIHSRNMLHRDMKASNILITKGGILKIADFGLARMLIKQKDQPSRYTNRVVTLWYRPPELLLGERNYGPAIDMWGAGCIMAELWIRRPIMQGNSEQQQLQFISKLCGSINTTVWPDVSKLELYTKMKLPKGYPREIEQRLGSLIDNRLALALIDRLLCLDPSKRLDSDGVFEHEFFCEEPAPAPLRRMLSGHTESMFELHTARRHAINASAPARNSGQYRERIF